LKNNSKDEIRLVAKFGGSSLDSPEKIQRAASSVAQELKKRKNVAVVVSAMGKTTDDLLSLATSASNGSISKQDQDSILSMGERLSARIFSASLRSHGVQTYVFDPAEDAWPIISNESFTDADPLIEESIRLIKQNVLPLIEKGIVPIIPGFVGKTRKGGLTTLGRGGSDITAFLLAEGIGADRVVLVSDVDGVLTADPKIVETPEVIEKISVARLAGLTNTGTKFLHLKALKYKQETTDVYLLNSALSDLNARGTWIHGSLPDLEVTLGEDRPVISITFIGEQISAHPQIFLEILRNLELGEVRICGMTGNHNSATFYLTSPVELGTMDALHGVVTSHPETMAMAVRKNLALLQITGLGLEETPGIIGGISEPLRENGINIFGILTVTSSVDLFVDWDEKERAIDLLGVSLRRMVKDENITSE